MKKTVLIALAVLMSMGLRAQSVTETVANVANLSVPAYSLTLDKDVKLVQNAMNQRLKDVNLKTKNTEGYVAAIQQMVESLSPATINLYTKVEEQGKKKERVTVVTVCAVSNDLTADQNILKNNVRSWLEDFKTYLNKYEARMQMEEEMENLKKAEKIQKSALSDLNSLEKNIESDKDKIESKKAEIEKLKKKIADCQEDIKKLQSNIEKNTSKKADAQKKVDEANRGVSAAQGEVEKYRRMAE